MGSMSIPAITPEAPLEGSGRARVIQGRYAALDIDSETMDPILRELRSLVTDENLDSFLANRVSRDGDHFHMTLIQPREFKALAKELKGYGRRVPIPEDEISFEVLGIGTATSEISQAWFAVCRSAEMGQWRRGLDLPAQDFHITLAFGDAGDVHGPSKGIDSLI